MSSLDESLVLVREYLIEQGFRLSEFHSELGGWFFVRTGATGKRIEVNSDGLEIKLYYADHVGFGSKVFQLTDPDSLAKIAEHITLVLENKL